MPAVTNWNRYPIVEAEFTSFDRPEQARERIARDPSLIARGLGRSYGDASLHDRILSGVRYNKILAFDPDTGRLTAQAGVSLADLLEVFVPRGWFLPVTPGSKFVTIGGAIAADVHGKNHHVDGSFCRHLEMLTLMTADGEVRTCSRDREPDLFRATCGGMGLTGILLDATFRLKRVETAYIREEIVEAPDLARVMEAFDASASWTYSVAWIDCLATGARLGRSLLMRGEHALRSELVRPDRQASPLQPPARRKVTVPFPFPSFALNGVSVRTFNSLYYWKHARGTIRRIVDYEPFFYPLDSIHHWNRIYGKRGFVQYQFVLPLASSAAGMQAVLERIGKQGWGSFLAVLKLFGPQDDLLSFPMEGYTLALDFPIRDGLFAFLDELDRVVLDHGGRLYLAKDARMSPDTYRAGYPHAHEFKEIVRRWNPDGKIRSRLAERLEML